MPHENYKSGDKISRGQALHDLKDDGLRLVHSYTDAYVNLVRIVGVSDRDKSQKLGRILAILSALFVVGAYVIAVI